MKKLSIISLVLYMLCSLNVNATETNCFWKSKTPWQKMLTVLYAHGVDTTGMGVTSLVPAGILNEATSDLAKTFGVKKELVQAFTKQERIGDVICQYMQLAYPKQNEKHAYYRTRYSTDEYDYDEFIISYPNSRYIDEMKWKRNCMEAYWYWELSTSLAECGLANSYSEIVSPCKYEGFGSVEADLRAYSETYKDWELLTSHREKDGYEDCIDFVRFKASHNNYLSGFEYFIDDSISNCEHNNAWQAAKNANTIAAYRNYLSSYPHREHDDEVRKKISDYEDWMDARDKGNYEAYANYVELHPSGDSVKIAEELMRKIEEVDWNRKKNSNNWRDFSDYIKKYPNGIYTMQADAKMKAIWNTPDVDMNKLFTIISPYSAKDSGLVFLSNIDNRKHDVTFEFYATSKGKKRLVLSKTLHPGDYMSYKLKNGTYEVEISSPWNRHWKLRESVTPTHGSMTINNYLYSLQYYIYDLTDSKLKQEEIEKKYSDSSMGKKSAQELKRLMAIEMLQISLDDNATMENGIYTIFTSGYVDLNVAQTEVITGESLKESKEAFYKIIENDVPELVVAVGWAGLGLRVVSKNSFTGKVEIVEFSPSEIKTFARKLEKKLGM